MRRRTGALVVLVAVALLAGCPGSPMGPGPALPDRLVIVPPGGTDDRFALHQRETARLRAMFDGVDVSDDARWASRDAAVATVAAGGWVTAVSPGEATISAAYAEFVAEFLVTVLAGSSPSAPDHHRLSVSIETPGTGVVTSDPPGIACGVDCTEEYESGTPVSLTATPRPGTAFTGWEGDPDCGAELTMDRDVSCVAEFAAVEPTRELSVAFDGSGSGHVRLDPPGVVCESGCREGYAAGTVVTLTAMPAASSTIDWHGHADCDDGVVTMDVDVACIATFDTLEAVLEAPAACNVGGPCRFSASRTRGPASTFRWDFGDGSTTTTGDRVVTHTYALAVAPGATRPVTVELAVEDASGNRDEAATTVELRNPNLRASIRRVAGPSLVADTFVTTFDYSASSRGTPTVTVIAGPGSIIEVTPTKFVVETPAKGGEQQVTVRFTVSDDGSYSYRMIDGVVEDSFAVPTT